jgi:hypothetical protein
MSGFSSRFRGVPRMSKSIFLKSGPQGDLDESRVAVEQGVAPGSPLRGLQVNAKPFDGRLLERTLRVRTRKLLVVLAFLVLCLGVYLELSGELRSELMRQRCWEEPQLCEPIRNLKLLARIIMAVAGATLVTCVTRWGIRLDAHVPR